MNLLRKSGGPITLYFLFNLYTTIESIIKTQKAKILFLYRSGLRIFDLLKTFLDMKSLDLETQYDFLKFSRLISIKLMFLVDKNLFLELIKKLYASPAEAQFALTGISERNIENENFEDLLTDKTFNTLLYSEAYLSRLYLKKAFSGYKNIILIDEGWSGSLCLPIELGFPEVNFITLFFGLINKFSLNGITPKKVIGIIFNSQNGLFDPYKKEQCFLFHKHWIESFFEPSNVPSVSKITEADIEKSQSHLEHKVDKVIDYVDIVYNKTKEYIKSNANVTIKKLVVEYREALEKIYNMIIFPELEDVKILKGKFRSHDLGKIGGLYSVILPFDRFCGDSPELRIRDALWQFGQVALEFPKNPILKREICKKLLEQNSNINNEIYFDPRQSMQLDDMTKYIAIEELKYDPNKKVGIIVRTKDRPILLRRAINSISNQKLQNFIVVIVNDGGNINDVLYILNTSTIDPSKVIIVNNSYSKGMEYASNAGIKAIQTKFIAIHDDDDEWHPDFLLKTISFLSFNNNYKGVITKSMYVEEEITLSGEIIEKCRIPFNEWVTKIHLSELCVCNIFPPIAFVYDREIYDKIGGYDEKLPVLGDWDFNIRFLLESDIGVIDEILAYYRVRTNLNSLYPSSLVGGRKLHIEFNALLRNKFIRLANDKQKYLILSLLLNLGYYKEDERYRMSLILEQLKR